MYVYRFLNFSLFAYRINPYALTTLAMNSLEFLKLENMSKNLQSSVN